MDLNGVYFLNFISVFFSKAVFLGMLVISERSRFIDKPS